MHVIVNMSYSVSMKQTAFQFFLSVSVLLFRAGPRDVVAGGH